MLKRKEQNSFSMLENMYNVSWYFLNILKQGMFLLATIRQSGDYYYYIVITYYFNHVSNKLLNSIGNGFKMQR